MAKIYSKVIMPVTLADYGGALFEFAYSTLIRGFERSYANDELTLNGLDPNSQPTYAEMGLLINNGGYFEGIKLGLEFINTAAAQQDVPAGIRGATYLDEEGVEQNRNWIDWLKASSSANVISNGTIYVTKANFNGDLLNSDELQLAHAQTGVSVLEWAEAQARYADEAYTVFEL